MISTESLTICWIWRIQSYSLHTGHVLVYILNWAYDQWWWYMYVYWQNLSWAKFLSKFFPVKSGLYFLKYLKSISFDLSQKSGQCDWPKHLNLSQNVIFSRNPTLVYELMLAGFKFLVYHVFDIFAYKLNTSTSLTNMAPTSNNS